MAKEWQNEVGVSLEGKRDVLWREIDLHRREREQRERKGREKERVERKRE